MFARAATCTNVNTNGVDEDDTPQEESPASRSPEDDPLELVHALWHRIATAPPPEEPEGQPAPEAKAVSATTDDMDSPTKRAKHGRQPGVGKETPNESKAVERPAAAATPPPEAAPAVADTAAQYMHHHHHHHHHHHLHHLHHHHQQHFAHMAYQPALPFAHPHHPLQMFEASLPMHQQQQQQLQQPVPTPCDGAAPHTPPLLVGQVVRVVAPIGYDVGPPDQPSGIIPHGSVAYVTSVPGEEPGSIAEVQLEDGRQLDVFAGEVVPQEVELAYVCCALVIVRAEAVLCSYQNTILRRLERVRQQVVADFEAALVLRPPGLELLPQKGREEAFRLHLENNYTSNMKAVLHDRYKKMYGKAYIEVVGPTDPTPTQKKGRRIGAAAVAASLIVAITAQSEMSIDFSNAEPYKLSPRGARRRRAAKNRRPMLAVYTK